jgi:hypothetical protein
MHLQVGEYTKQKLAIVRQQTWLELLFDPKDGGSI